jgi:hypothetical protein
VPHKRIQATRQSRSPLSCRDISPAYLVCAAHGSARSLLGATQLAFTPLHSTTAADGRRPVRFGQLTNNTPSNTKPKSAPKVTVRRSERSAAASTIATSGFRLMYTATCAGVSRVRANVHRKRIPEPRRRPQEREQRHRLPVESWECSDQALGQPERQEQQGAEHHRVRRPAQRGHEHEPVPDVQKALSDLSNPELLSAMNLALLELEKRLLSYCSTRAGDHRDG